MARKRKVVLDQGGLVLFWDPPDDSNRGKRMGIILDATFCDDPECRWAHILAVSVDLGGDDSDGDEAEYARSRVQMHIELDAWKLDIPPESEDCPLEPGLERRLRALFDRERESIREALEMRWRQAHGVNRDS